MKKEKDIREDVIIQTAYRMMVAARTAPKGKGVDNLELGVLTGKEIKKVSDHLLKMHEEGRAPDYFARDARNLLQASAVFLAGTRIAPLGISPCGHCGFADCAEKNKYPEVPCCFNTGDLGIALGSAVSIAMENRVDNRIMYTVGVAAAEMKLLGDDVRIIYGVPLSSSSKSPFFDRTQ